MNFRRSTTRPNSALLGSMWLPLLLLLAANIRTSYGNVLCPGQPEENYCDCDGDCTGFPEWCGCQEAKDCCAGAQPVVLCPGQPRENYCDCTGDCTNQPDWCSCQEARECCNGANGYDWNPYDANDYYWSASNGANIVLCPGQPKENYCDCTGDCTDQPDWCSCQEARECCNGANGYDRNPSDDANEYYWSAANDSNHCPLAVVFVAGCVGGMVLLLAVVLFRRIRNCREQTRSGDGPPKTNPGDDDDDSDASTVVSDDDEKTNTKW